MDFYRNMDEGELRAYHQQIKDNLANGINPVGGMEKELEQIEAVMREKGIDPNEQGVGASLTRLKYYITEMSKCK